jgi:hypothetical protein
MIKRIVVRNASKLELGVMLEPWTDREDIEPEGEIVISGDFSDSELVIDIGDDNFVSVWSPPGSSIVVKSPLNPARQDKS